MLVLGIETSCDETAVSLVEGTDVLSSEVSSSVHLHSQYGGVVPEIASRFHTEYILSVFRKTFKDAGKKLEEVDLIAVTKGPGLPGSLLVGIAFAKAVSFTLDVPLVGVNHIHAHIFSCFLDRRGSAPLDDIFPFLGMVISGGHTNIYSCNSLEDLRLLGRTRDDAVGEAFDKVAKILGLQYPGGPVVEERASGDFKGEVIDFPRALLKDSPGIDFSFSGIKTAVMYHWKDAVKTDEEINRICFSFQEAIVDTIDHKIAAALDITGAGRLAVGGGVLNNGRLRSGIIKRCEKAGAELFLPDKKYCSDNAAMIAYLGSEMYMKGRRSDLYLNAEPDLKL